MAQCRRNVNKLLILKLQEHQGHKFFQEQFGIPTFCDLCSNIMEKGHNCQST